MPRDPRLNSVHLNGARKEDFRQAREELLRACGHQTLGLTPFHQPNARSSQTVVQKSEANAPPNVVCWLIDEDYIYPLKPGLNTVGRSAENDVVVRDGYVSRRHCAILVHSDLRCEIFDTASKNGTFVNGTKIDGARKLQKNDQIRMCDCILTFMIRTPGEEQQSHNHHETLTHS